MDPPIAYCRACLIKVAVADTPEDRERLDALLDTWTPGGELVQRQGHCARCGQFGEVSYYESPPRPGEMSMKSSLYCNPCFVSLGTSELAEDAARLEQLLGFRGIGSELQHAQGVCARCGKEGEVVYYETARD